MVVDLHAAARPMLSLLVVLPAGLSLAWRLRAPFVPLALTGGADLLLRGTAPTQFGPQTVVLGVAVATYTAAVHLSGRRALAAGVLSCSSLWAAHTLTRDGDVVDFFPIAFWAVVWLAGRLVRRKALEARDAGARAALLEVEAREAAATERDRIARELHDVVAHAVSLMVVQAAAERVALGASSPRTTAALDAVETTGRQALVELRTMLGALRATVQSGEHAPLPDLTGVTALVESVRATGLVVDLELDGDLAVVPAGLSLAAYRVVQECLTNAVRHGSGRAVAVVRVDVAAVTVEVRNELGAPSLVGSGRGLAGMRERVGVFGGELDAGPRGDQWVVEARLPMGLVARR